MIKANTKYSKSLLRDFEIFHFFRKSILKSILTIVLVIYLLVVLYFISCIILSGLYFQLVYIKSNGFETMSLFNIMGFVVFEMILPTIYYFGIYKPLVKRLKRNYRIEKDMELEYEFGKNEMKVSLSTPFENDSFIYTYNSIDKIYETSKYFYIYFSKYDLFILAKENLANADISNLENIFKENISENKFVRR